LLRDNFQLGQVNQPANLPHDTSFTSVIIHINVNQLDLSLIIP